MGTRSTVKFFNEYNSERPILSVYQQYDGYIEGVGHSLAEWLKDKKVINGISGQKAKDGFANGMGCLAAQYVAQNKTEIGGFYLTDIEDEQEYNIYDLVGANGRTFGNRWRYVIFYIKELFN